MIEMKGVAIYHALYSGIELIQRKMDRIYEEPKWSFGQFIMLHLSKKHIQNRSQKYYSSSPSFYWRVPFINGDFIFSRTTHGGSSFGEGVPPH